MAEETLPEVPGLVAPAVQEVASQPYDIAIIIDNVVYQVINTDGQFAAQLLAQPTFVQVSVAEAKVGWIYDPATGKFSPPETPGQ